MTTVEIAPADVARERWRGHAAMALFALLASGSFSLGARAAPYIDPSALIGLRFIVATGVLLGVLVGTGVLRGVSPGESLVRLRALAIAPWRFLLLGTFFGVYFILMFEALRVAPPAPLGAVFTLTPFLSAIFVWIAFRERTSRSVLVALTIGALGAVWVIFRGDIQALLGLDVGLGEALFFIGAVSHAMYTPLIRTFNRGEPGPVFVIGISLGAAIVTVIAGFPAILNTDWTALPPVVWLAVLYLSVATTAITATLMQFAAMRLTAPKVMAYTYLVPTFVILLEGISGAGWAEAAILPGVGATLVSLALLLRE